MPAPGTIAGIVVNIIRFCGFIPFRFKVVAAFLIPQLGVRNRKEIRCPVTGECNIIERPLPDRGTFQICRLISDRRLGRIIHCLLLIGLRLPIRCIPLCFRENPFRHHLAAACTGICNPGCALCLRRGFYYHFSFIPVMPERFPDVLIFYITASGAYIRCETIFCACRLLLIIVCGFISMFVGFFCQCCCTGETCKHYNSHQKRYAFFQRLKGFQTVHFDNLHQILMI